METHAPLCPFKSPSAAGRKSASAMAYYAALVSLVELLKEMSLSEHQYPKSRFPKQQITSLYEKMSHLQELLEDYSPNDEEDAGLLDRIRDAACLAQDLIESQGVHRDMERMKDVVDSIMGRGHPVFENVEEEVDPLVEEVDSIVGRVFESVKKHSIVERGHRVLERAKKHSIVGRGHRVLERVKEHSTVGRGQRVFERAKGEVDSIVGRGHGFLERVKEEVDLTAEKGYKDIFEKVKEEVDSIVEDLTRVKKNHTNHQVDLQVSVGASTKLPRGGTTMVGFERHLTKLKAQLVGDSSRLEIISIVGMGGVGKTTLARNIFDDKLIHYHFDLRVWVTVSQSYHLRNILLAIANSLNISNEKLHGAEDGVLKNHIRQHLLEQRYLIIVDDVWDLKIWDDLKSIFPNDKKSRSRIIITTRQVASLASASDFINQIPLLEYDQSWDLFRDKALCPPELEDIGRSIVRNCGGLPLAIVVVAGLLSKVNTTRSDWEEVARNLSSIASANDERFSKILSLSYNYLPHHLKPCFLYFGGFPDGYEISVSRLVKLWAAEGFLKPSTSKSLEEVAEEYLEELFERNLVLITKRRSNGKFKHCSIHDLLRDLCLERARNEQFLLLLHKHSATGHIHRFFLHPNSSSNIHIEENDFLHVRSFVSFGDQPSHFKSHPSNFMPLRVLDAPHIDFNFSPHRVFRLLHLRYLALLRGESKYISSSVSKLQNLQTLIVVASHWDPISLPSEIWKMPQLRHIMIDQVKLPPIPRGVRIIDGVPLLGMLQTLYKVKYFTFDSSTIEMIPNLKKLKLVTYRDDEEMNGLKTLLGLHKLETLDIYFSQGFSPVPRNFFPVNLIKLTLRGCKLPWKDLATAGSLPNLQVLKLRWESFVGREWEPIEGEFPKLKYLLLERLYDLEHWRAENIHFPCLEQLHIRYCQKLEIPSEVGDIPTLQLIELHYCGSFVESRALEIQQEQEDNGNSGLQVRCWEEGVMRGGRSIEYK